MRPGQICAYAHSVSGAPPATWQTMCEHAHGVALLAGTFAKPFGMEHLARAAGLLHDLGKYSEPFQRKLQGESLRVDHSTFGARLAAERYGMLGQLIAYAVAGHHAGLANGTGIGIPTALQVRTNMMVHDVYKAMRMASWTVIEND